MPYITNIYFITAISIIGGGLFGFDISSMSAIISTDQYLNYFHHPTSLHQGGITAAMPGGSFVGAIASGWISDQFGRKFAIFFGCCLWLVGSILSAAAQNVGMLVVGRIINGLCVGLCSAQVPVYVSELAPPRIRGRVVGLQQWAITWGIMIMFYVSYGCSYVSGPAAFRIPWALQMVPALILMLGILFLPASPRWLARKGRWEDCLHVLAIVHGKGNKADPLVMAEYEDIKNTVALEMNNRDVRFRELLHKKMLARTTVGISMQVWSQLTGMNVMMYYITYVFGMAGLQTGTKGNLIASSIQYVINVIMTLPGLYLVDKIGRRPLLLTGGTFMAIWMYINAGVLSMYGHYVPGGVNHIPEESWTLSGAPARAVIASTYLFVASYAPSWGPVSWIYPPEIFPLRVRGRAVAVCTASNWAFNLALGLFTPPAFEHIQWKTYVIFGVFCTAMTIQVFFMFPETHNKTLEEIEEIFESRVPAWKTAGFHTRLGDRARLGDTENIDIVDEKDEKADNTHNEVPVKPV